MNPRVEKADEVAFSLPPAKVRKYPAQGETAGHPLSSGKTLPGGVTPVGVMSVKFDSWNVTGAGTVLPLSTTKWSRFLPPVLGFVRSARSPVPKAMPRVGRLPPLM